MLQELLPPPATESKSRILDKVPALKWGAARECTFLGAMEAALAVTDHPFSYDDMMGYTGMAFRTRWYKPPQPLEWCPSSACGEMEEEIGAVTQSTGWSLNCKNLFKEQARQEYANHLVHSIDAGLPVLAYDSGLNMGLVYGYQDAGESFLFHRYRKGEDADAVQSITPAKLGWMWIFLGQHDRTPTPQSRLHQSLRRIINNFHRGIGREGPGDYWYGADAFEQWSQDIGRAGVFSPEQQKKLFFVSWWNFDTLADARLAAVCFLKRHLDCLPAARPHLENALAIFQQEADLLNTVMHERQAFLGPWTGKTIDDWTDSVRQQEREILASALALEQSAVPKMQSALETFE